MAYSDIAVTEEMTLTEFLTEYLILVLKSDTSMESGDMILGRAMVYYTERRFAHRPLDLVRED